MTEGTNENSVAFTASRRLICFFTKHRLDFALHWQDKPLLVNAVPIEGHVLYVKWLRDAERSMRCSSSLLYRVYQSRW